MLKPIILAIVFAVLAALLPSLTNAKSSNGGAGKAKDSRATMQARWPALVFVDTILS
jgi:hypothetical protein